MPSLSLEMFGVGDSCLRCVTSFDPHWTLHAQELALVASLFQNLIAFRCTVPFLHLATIFPYFTVLQLTGSVSKTSYDLFLNRRPLRLRQSARPSDRVRRPHTSGPKRSPQWVHKLFRPARVSRSRRGVSQRAPAALSAGGGG